MKSLFAGLLLALCPVTASAGTVFDDPGDIFDVPGLGESYVWYAPVPLTIGAEVERFTVRVQGGPQFLRTFQVFGKCDGSSLPFNAGFDFSVVNSNGTDTIWTSATRGDSTGCGYHNYLHKTLPVGETIFTVTYNGADGFIPPLAEAQIRIGDIIPAVPLPGGLVLLPAALVALGGIRFRAEEKQRHRGMA
ncbi:MAG: hypothetical protein AAGF94_06260 [Pseudomonadota bacterium]